MKSTGIMRRFDDHGRIAVPLEVRKRLGIEEGQLAEVFADEEGRIILVKRDDPERSN